MATRRTVAAIAVLLLCSCSPTTYVLRLDANGGDGGYLFPPPQTLEVARYRYLGQLTGEDNLQPAGERGGGFKAVFNWLVGLVDGDTGRTVLQRPQSGTVDGEGRIYVTDVSRKAVFVFDEKQGRLDVWDDTGGGRRFASPIAVAIGAGGQVLVTDSELALVLRFDRDGKPLGDFGGGTLLRPTGIARDGARRLTYVADTYAHDIKVFDDDGRLVDTIGRRGDGLGEFNFPTHLAFARGTLYVTDMMNSRIQGLTGDGGVRLHFGERGLYVGNLVRPKGVATDSDGNIYVIESMYDTLLVYDPRGRLLLSIGGTGKDAGRFYLPAGIWIDSQDRVYVADMFNGRVVVFQFLGGT